MLKCIECVSVCMYVLRVVVLVVLLGEGLPLGAQGTRQLAYTTHHTHKTTGQHSKPSLTCPASCALALPIVYVKLCVLTPGGGGEEHPREAQEASHRTGNHLYHHRHTQSKAQTASVRGTSSSTCTVHMPTPRSFPLLDSPALVP